MLSLYDLNSAHISHESCMCVLILLHFCPHITIHVSSSSYLIRLCPHTTTCVLILLPHTFVSSYYYMCPHTPTSYVCVLILLHVSSYYYMCPHTTTTNVCRTWLDMCPHTATSYYPFKGFTSSQFCGCIVRCVSEWKEGKRARKIERLTPKQCCMYVCVCERESERERDGEREGDNFVDLIYAHIFFPQILSSWDWGGGVYVHNWKSGKRICWEKKRAANCRWSPRGHCQN